jgi:hypothetical protein
MNYSGVETYLQPVVRDELLGERMQRVNPGKKARTQWA